MVIHDNETSFKETHTIQLDLHTGRHFDFDTALMNLYSRFPMYKQQARLDLEIEILEVAEESVYTMAASIMSSKGFDTDCGSDSQNEASARAPRKQWGTSPRARKERREKSVKFENSSEISKISQDEPIREPQPTVKSAATPVDKPKGDQSVRDDDPSVRQRVIGLGRHQIPGGTSDVSSIFA